MEQKDAVIYEAHVRGLTRHGSVRRLSTLLGAIPGCEAVVDIPDAVRGTYAGVALMAKGLQLRLAKQKASESSDAGKIHELLEQAMSHARDLALS